MKKIPAQQYHKMRERHPECLTAIEALGEAISKSGPLEEKFRQLIQLAAAATLRSEGAVHSHVRRALEAGATADEVRHSIMMLTSTIGFPTVVAAMSWADDVLEAS